MALGNNGLMDTARPDLIDCRLARPGDAYELARMSRELVERGHGWSWQAPRIARCIRAGDCVVLCAQDRTSRKIVGFAIMEFFDQRAHLNLLAVVPERRRHGIATALLAWLDKTALISGVAEVTLEVRAQNGSARRFYAKQGFEEFGQIPRYYSGRETAYRLRKKLRERFRDDGVNQPR